MTKERIQNLRNLYQKGKLSPKLKIATRQLIIALSKNNGTQIETLSYLHQQISSDYLNQGGFGNTYEYTEDQDHNKKVVGTTAYHEFDMIWHGGY